MHPNLQTTLLLLFPVLSGVLATSEITNKPDAAKRDLTDSISGFFGDPTAIVKELSKCMASCAHRGMLDLKCSTTSSSNTTSTTTSSSPDSDSTSSASGKRDEDKAEDKDNKETEEDTGIDLSCLCKRPSGSDDSTPGKAWEDATRQCFADAESNTGWGVFCDEEDFEKGKLLEVCKNVDGDKPEQIKEVEVALADRFTLGDMIESIFGGGEDEESAAAVVGGKSGVVGVMGAVVAAAVGWAFVMV